MMSEDEFKDIESKLINKLGFLVLAMMLHIEEYQDQITSHLGAVLTDELERMIAERVVKLGLKSRDKNKELKEPLSEY